MYIKMLHSQFHIRPTLYSRSTEDKELVLAIAVLHLVPRQHHIPRKKKLKIKIF